MKTEWTRFLALWGLGIVTVYSTWVAVLYWLWVILEPLTVAEAGRAPYFFGLWSAGAGASLSCLLVLWRRGVTSPTRALWGARRLAACAVVIGSVAIGGVLWRDMRWDLRLQHVPSMREMPLNQHGYELEKLPFSRNVSFVRGHQVYFVHPDRGIFKADTRELPIRDRIGDSPLESRMVFVSSRNTVFVSGHDGTHRSVDGCKTWRRCLESEVWRMDEHDSTGTLYAGSYGLHRAAVIYKSQDDGQSWGAVFSDDRLDHVHTIRCDPESGRLYAATGDTPYRGQLYSDDAGVTWTPILAGVKQGHTDVAISRSFVFWGSDDSMGRVIRVKRGEITPETTQLWCKDQHAWFVVAEDRQVFVGTYSTQPADPTPAYLMASSDEGGIWQKLFEVGQVDDNEKALVSSSRRVSADGWLFFSTSRGDCYRVRKSPESE